MSDTGNAAAPAASEGTAVVETPAVVPVDTVEKVAPAAAADTSTDIEVDWRAEFGDDAELQKLLARSASKQELGKKLVNQEKAIRSRASLPTLPEGATDEEVAAHRKALGIPEKPDGYGLTLPQDLGATEAETQALNAWAEIVHQANLPPQYAKAAVDAYAAVTQQTIAAREKAASEAVIENIADLRNEYPGREYMRNMALGAEFLARHADGNDEVVKAILTTRLPNGVPLRNYAPFVKILVRAARETAPDDVLIAGDAVGMNGQSLDEEKEALLKERVDNMNAFRPRGRSSTWTPEKAARLEVVTAAINQRRERAA